MTDQPTPSTWRAKYRWTFCTVCHQPMPVIEPGQTTHPTCAPHSAAHLTVGGAA